MTGSVDHNDPTDAWLVAYLDGVLDEQQASELRHGTCSERRAFAKNGVAAGRIP